MTNLPIFKDDNKNLMLLQNSWKAAILPTLNNEINQGILVKVFLKAGENRVNHLLGRKQVGWIISDIDAASTIYRSAPFNDSVLILNSSADCTVEIWCF